MHDLLALTVKEVSELSEAAGVDPGEWLSTQLAFASLSSAGGSKSSGVLKA